MVNVNGKIEMVSLKDLNLISKMSISEKDALIIVDIQNDFMPKGALPVEEGDQIIDSINNIAQYFYQNDNIVVVTQDWHPPNHFSFASSHQKKPYEPFQAEGIGPVLWPNHCIQGTFGAQFHPELEVKFANAIIRKGYHLTVDSYSVFLENDKVLRTGLNGYLEVLGINRILLCGLALDYCVYYSAIDGKNLGFDIIVVLDLSKAVDEPFGHLEKALKHMEQKGIQFINSENIRF